MKADEQRFSVENAKMVGPNVISCELITGSGDGQGDETRWFITGFYSPPSEKDGATTFAFSTENRCSSAFTNSAIPPQFLVAAAAVRMSKPAHLRAAKSVLVNFVS